MPNRLGLIFDYSDETRFELLMETENCWATFRLEGVITQPDWRVTESDGTVTIKSLGTVVENNEPRRWIEIEMLFDSQDKTDPEPRIYTTFYKLLIKESAFTDENNPVDGIVRGYFAHASNRKDLKAAPMDLETPADMHGIFTKYFHAPFVMSRKLKSRQIETERGTFECAGSEIEDEKHTRTTKIHWTRRLFSNNG